MLSWNVSLIGSCDWTDSALNEQLGEPAKEALRSAPAATLPALDCTHGTAAGVVGELVGLCVGVAVGEGAGVGKAGDGLGVGVDIGAGVGELLGPGAGVAVGVGVGVGEAAGDGLGVGVDVGELVGLGVGVPVVGALLGASVGALLGPCVGVAVVAAACHKTPSAPCDRARFGCTHVSALHRRVPWQADAPHRSSCTPPMPPCSCRQTRVRRAGQQECTMDAPAVSPN